MHLFLREIFNMDDPAQYQIITGLMPGFLDSLSHFIMFKIL
jgi:hypothetical protein